MRADQIKRLAELEEDLADFFLSEADPKLWPKEAIDLYRTKRAASDTGALLARVQTLMAGTMGGGRHDPDNEKAADRMIEIAEQRATQAMQRAMERSRSA